MPPPPPRIETEAAVAGTVVDSAGDPVEGADVSVTTFFIPEPRPDRGDGDCIGKNIFNSAEAKTNASGQFAVVLRNGPAALETCGIVVAWADGGESDTISGIRIRYRDPPPETASVQLILR